MLLYSLAILMCAFVLTTSHAFTVSPLESAHLSSDDGLWRPSGGVMLKEGVACARANQGDCESCVNETVAVCTFDYGKHFSIQRTKFPFCGNQGVVLEGKLLCPLNAVSVNMSAINFTVVSYEGQSSLVESVEESTMLSFFYWPEVEIRKIEFKGNTIHFSEDNTYLMNAIVTYANSSMIHTLFISTDGYTWKAWGEVPLDINDKSVMIKRGEQKIAISNFTSSEHHFVSSGFRGKWWDSMKSLNVSVPPASVVTSSGIVIESGMTNTSSPLKLTASINGNSKKKVLNLIELYKNSSGSSEILDDFDVGCNGSNSCLSSYVSLMNVNDSHIVALFDFIPLNSQQHSVAVVSLEIDDSDEKKKKLEERQRAEENARLREEAWKKAQRELAERKKNERREKRRKQLERRALFFDADAENIKLAKSRLEEDGEMVVVRDVIEDMIDIEKSTFFL